MYYLFDRITQGEVLYIKRKRTGRTLIEHAKESGCTLYSLKYQEQDDTIKSQPHLELWEECLIYMRRNDIYVSQIAEELDVTKQTVVAWRKGQKDYMKLFNLFYETSS